MIDLPNGYVTFHGHPSGKTVGRKFVMLDSRPLKSSRTCVYETCRALNEAFKLAEDLKNPSLNKSQKNPHGSLEVKCGSCEHDIDRVSEMTFLEVMS